MERLYSALDKTFTELERLEKSKELRPNVYMVKVSKLIYITLKSAHAKGHKCCGDDDLEEG